MASFFWLGRALAVNKDVSVWDEGWQVDYLSPARSVCWEDTLAVSFQRSREREHGSKKSWYTSLMSERAKERSSRHVHSFLRVFNPKNKNPPTHQSKSSACSSYSPIRPSQRASPSSSSPPYQSNPRALFLFHHTPAAACPLAAPASSPSRLA